MAARATQPSLLDRRRVSIKKVSWTGSVAVAVANRVELSTAQLMLGHSELFASAGSIINSGVKQHIRPHGYFFELLKYWYASKYI